MRLLLDNIARSAETLLKDNNHDIKRVLPDPGDEKLLKMAIEEERCVVTFDKDFCELVLRNQVRHFGIIRLHDISAKAQGEVILRIVNSHFEDLISGSIATFKAGRLRIRRPQEG